MIFFSVGIVTLIATSLLQGTVAPISNGENMWKIISRIEATNTTSITALQNFQSTCTAITTVPYTITTAGKYCLANDVTISGVQPAIIIAAQNVYLDLSEREIFGTGGTTVGITIQSGSSNITVLNGTINGVNTGVSLTGTNPTVVLKNLNIQAVTTGINASASCNGILMNNIFIANTATAINLSGILSSVLTDCVINNATTTAINISNTCAFNVFKKCVVNTGANGMVFDAFSAYNYVVGCNFANQSTVGINLGGSQRNVIDATKFEGIGTGGSYAIDASSTFSVLLRQCTLNGNANGINADSSTNIVITGCSITGIGSGNGITGTTAPTLFALNNIVRNHTTNYNNLVGTTPILTSGAIAATNAGFWTNISG